MSLRCSHILVKYFNRRRGWWLHRTTGERFSMIENTPTMEAKTKIMYKLNIIEPWESGTESAIEADLIKKNGIQFLLFVEKIIKVNNDNAQYFICELKNKENQNAFDNSVAGIYLIDMVFDKNIQNTDSELFDLGIYRSNFLLGEIII